MCRMVSVEGVPNVAASPASIAKTAMTNPATGVGRRRMRPWASQAATPEPMAIETEKSVRKAT